VAVQNSEKPAKARNAQPQLTPDQSDRKSQLDVIAC
jgi:hypothetical protein